MIFLALPIFVFFELIKWLIFIEIILSWIALLGIVISIPFIRAIIYPMFNGVKKAFPAEFL